MFSGNQRIYSKSSNSILIYNLRKMNMQTYWIIALHFCNQQNIDKCYPELKFSITDYI